MKAKPKDRASVVERAKTLVKDRSMSASSAYSAKYKTGMESAKLDTFGKKKGH